jgi:hypothetical protein
MIFSSWRGVRGADFGLGGLERIKIISNDSYKECCSRGRVALRSESDCCMVIGSCGNNALLSYQLATQESPEFEGYKWNRQRACRAQVWRNWKFI